MKNIKEMGLIRQRKFAEALSIVVTIGSIGNYNAVKEYKKVLQELSDAITEIASRANPDRVLLKYLSEKLKKHAEIFPENL